MEQIKGQNCTQNRTRWFAKYPDGDTYYGRVYHGRVYEFILCDAPKFTIEDEHGYLDKGPLEIYPGHIFHDSDSNSVTADKGESVLTRAGSSGNLGGYAETFYTAVHGALTAKVVEPGQSAYVYMDDGDARQKFDRETLTNFMSFIATARTLETISSRNLRHPDYQKYFDGKMPVPMKRQLYMDIILK